MAHEHEDYQKHVKKYYWIGGILGAFTIITVGLSYVDLPTHGMNILVGLIVAAFKASLVGLVFMHLSHERSLIYKVLVFTGIFVLGMFLLFYFSHEDPLLFRKFPGLPINH